jgi:hypothetical protein
LGENTAVTPAGKPVALRVTCELKSFWLVMVRVLSPLLSPASCPIVTAAGEAATVKSSEPTLITKVTFAVCVRLPFVAVIAGV